MIKIYGASDDLIEIEGSISDEIGDFNTPCRGIVTSEGTCGQISYKGHWHITLTSKGSDFIKLVEQVGDDKEHTDVDAKGLTSYSDVLVLKDIDWVKIGKKTFKK